MDNIGLEEKAPVMKYTTAFDVTVLWSLEHSATIAREEFGFCFTFPRKGERFSYGGREGTVTEVKWLGLNKIVLTVQQPF